MPKKVLNSNSFLPLALSFLCVQALVLWVATMADAMDSVFAMGATYALQLLAGLAAYSACCWRAWTSPPRLRMNWILICGSMLLWMTGMALSAWGDMVVHAPRSTAFISDFAFFIYGVPMLLAICLPDHRQRVWLLAGIDGLQALLAGCLVYIRLFSTIPFIGAFAPASIHLLVQTYLAENILLAVAVTARLLSCPRNTEERSLYRTLSLFLWSYAGCAELFNFFDIRSKHAVGFRSILMEAPFLLLALVLLLSDVHIPESKTAFRKTKLALFIETLSPIFFTLALTALGASIVRRHFHYGLAAIQIALVLYAVRATFLQNRYMQSEKELAEAKERLQKLSFQDALTGVPNRRHFDEIFEMEWSRAGRVMQPLSLLMVDADYFKRLNDHYGHPAGDECLVRLAQALKHCLPRSGDMLARYGGEEFAVILPTTDRLGAENVAVRMQEAVRALHIQNESPVGEFVTISVGISTYAAPALARMHELVDAADRALYKAKQNGRNRIEFCEMPIETEIVRSLNEPQPLPALAARDKVGTAQPAPAPGHEFS
ncbi:GGDEF domain-containing protein [Silvibacterium acidisoli]|uniref:GGDEF domain-containing protein n=1 Tax=Acidobacteriaceae bacterium ZG23-2 TaxID=2883246 RepID=UPI00406D1B7A